MNNENDIEKIIEQKSKELERIEVPNDLWLNLEAEINKLPKKRQINFQFINDFFNLNKIKIGYSFASIILLVVVGLLFFNRKDNMIIQGNTEIFSKPIETITPIVQEVNSKKQVEKKTVRKITKEMKIASLEKKAAKKIERVDEYSRLVYQAKLTEMDESIYECKKQYKSDMNELIMKNLAFVYEEKIKLLKDIIYKN